MEINLGEERIVELQAAFAEEQVRERAMAKRVDVFGQFAKFIQRPKPDDIEITAMQKRLEPFWFGAAVARYVYDRKHTYRVPVAPEVQATSVYGNELAVTPEQGRGFDLVALEHCQEEQGQELYLEAAGGREVKYEKYLAFPKNPVPDIATLETGSALVTLPEIRGSFVVRKLAAALMKTFQADKIFEERIDVQEITLYFRPIFAVEYLWQAKNKKQVVEMDGLTGEFKAESGELKKHVANVLANDALFDIGADVIGTVFPGVNVAVKVGRIAARKVIR